MGTSRKCIVKQGLGSELDARQGLQPATVRANDFGCQQWAGRSFAMSALTDRSRVATGTPKIWNFSAFPICQGSGSLCHSYIRGGCMPMRRESLGTMQVAHGTCVNRAAMHLMVAYATRALSEEGGASASRFRRHAEASDAPPLISSGRGQLHMPPSTSVLANSSLRRNTFSFHQTT